MSVRVERGTTWKPSEPTTLDAALGVEAASGSGVGESVGRRYDVSPDGKRFLLIKPVGEPRQGAAPRSLVVVLNWFQELKRLVPTGR
jgi:hypothetical protein